MRLAAALLLIAPAWGADRLPVSDPKPAEPSFIIGPTDALGGIQRYLASLRLGDTIAQIRQIYPPTREWPAYREPGGALRLEVRRGYSRWFPPRVGALRMAVRNGQLVHIQLIYDREHTRRKPVGDLAVDLSLVYGEPRRMGGAYFWVDGRSAIVASQAEVPYGPAGARELRTSLELMERDYFQP